jgi:broad specificity phosphatase PhoE
VRLAVKLDHAMRTTSLPPPEVIVTSPLARALETTQLGVKPLFSIRPIVLEGLRENLNGTEKNNRHNKGWIGQNFAAFDTENVDADDCLGSEYAKSVEPYNDMWRRVEGAFTYIFENFRDALVVALMSHCYVVQTIQREITGWDVHKEERRDKVEFFLGDTGAYAIVVKGVRN